MNTKTILLIENNASDAEQVKRELAQLKVDHRLQLAHNGAEGLELLTSAKNGQLPDLILLDVNLPKMNGFEFLRIIKNYHNLRDIKVYVISTSTEEYDKMLVSSLGADGYIVKPMHLSEAGKETESILKLKADLTGN